MLVTRSDLPVGSDWQGGITRPDLSPNPTCPNNYQPDVSHFVLTGAAASDWRSGVNDINTQSEVLQTAQMVRQDWRVEVEEPAATACIRSILKKQLTKAGMTSISFTPLPFPDITSYAKAFRLVGAESGVKIAVEFALLAKSRTEVILTVSGLYATRARIAAETHRLAHLLVNRVKA